MSSGPGGLFDAMQPFSTGGVYVNFLGNEGRSESSLCTEGKSTSGL